MAAAPAQTETTPPKGPSMVIQLGMLAGLTVLAVGIGWFAGGYLRGEVSPADEVHATANADAGHGEAAAGGHGEAASGGHGEADGEGLPPSSMNPKVLDLAPITTSLSAPTDTWVRLEMSVYFRELPPEGTLEKIQDDVIGYIRTVSLQQIEGASGFQHFKADLKERAQMLSGGRADAVLIRTLIFE